MDENAVVLPSLNQAIRDYIEISEKYILSILSRNPNDPVDWILVAKYYNARGTLQIVQREEVTKREGQRQ